MAAFDGLNEYEVRLDLKQTVPTDEIELVAGDTGVRLKLTVTDGGSPISLDGCYIVAVFSNNGSAAAQDSTDGSITIDGSAVTIDVRPAALTPGTVDCELQIYTSTEEEPQDASDCGVLVTTKRFSFDCREPLMNEDAIPALPGMPALTALLNEIAAAEQQRAETFAALAEAMRGCITGEGAPSSATDAVMGQTYFDTQNAALYVCTAVSPTRVWKNVILTGASANTLKVSRNASAAFAELPTGEMTLQNLVNRLAAWYSEINGKQDALTFDQAPASGSANPVTSGGVYAALHAGDMTTAADQTLTQEQTSVTLQGFECGEMYLIIKGGMSGGASARVSVNGDPEYAKFTTFAPTDCDEPDNAATIMIFDRPICGFAVLSRISGGDPDDEGFAVSSAMHCVPLPVDGITNYTSLTITAEGHGKFPAGTRFLLKGRP